MRINLLIIALAWVSTSNMCGAIGASKAPAVAPLAQSGTMQPRALLNTPPKVDFQTEVKPILQSRCQPCHFSGGVMYQRLPFDRPETIKTLGEKMFTRIKDENDRRVIRQFLSQ